MFPEREPRETLRFEGSKINCFRRDQSLSDLLYTVAAGNFKAGNSLKLAVTAVIHQLSRVTLHIDRFCNVASAQRFWQ